MKENRCFPKNKKIRFVTAFRYRSNNIVNELVTYIIVNIVKPSKKYQSGKNNNGSANERPM